jgi:hypothetical protein
MVMSMRSPTMTPPPSRGTSNVTPKSLTGGRHRESALTHKAPGTNAGGEVSRLRHTKALDLRMGARFWTESKYPSGER